MRITFKATRTITPAELWSTILTFQSLYVKVNLIAQGRIKDVVEYDTLAGDRFNDEFPLTIDTDHRVDEDLPEGAEIHLRTKDSTDPKAIEAIRALGEALCWHTN